LCPYSEVLNAAFSGNERMRGYVLDDQAVLRKHVMIFINGIPIRDREHLSGCRGRRRHTRVQSAVADRPPRRLLVVSTQIHYDPSA
jgi:molybdopterin synthase sulfur carrier subunit